MLEIHSLQAFKSIASAYSATTAYKYEVFVNFDARLLKINNVKNFKSLASAYSTTRANIDFERKDSTQIVQSLSWRRHPDLNRGIKVLQTLALPLGYSAVFDSS